MTSKLKVGFVFDDTLDNPDGVQQYVLTLGAWLTSQGHEVHYLVGATTRTDIPNVHSLSRNAKVRFNKNRLSIPLPVSRTRLRKLLADQSYDVLHVQMPYSPQFAARVVLEAPKDTAIVGTFHILPYGRLQKAGAQLLSKFISSSLKRFDTIVAVSPAAQDFARNVMEIESSLIPNAVDLKRFTKGRRLAPAGTTQTIAFLGRLVPRKGAMELLQALAWLKSNDLLGGRQLVIGGSGPEQPKLERYVATHGLGSSVQFVGQLDESAKANFFASGDVVVLPSLAGESFGIVVVEAIASGAGVTVGGDNPGYRFVLGATPQALVDPMQTEDLAQLLNQLLSEAGVRANLQAQQQKHIQQFDVPIVGAQIEAMYNQAIQKHAKV